MPLYDIHPPHPHTSHLPFSREPYKIIYVLYRLTTTLLLVPCWVAKYTLQRLSLRSYRPRPSWSLRQIIYVGFTRRMYKVTEMAGVTWGTRDPSEEPYSPSLKETAFVWAPPLSDRWRTGVLSVDKQYGTRSAKVEFTKVGCFVWPKEEVEKGRSTDGSVVVDVMDSWYQKDKKGEGEREDMKLIGVFMHGGGYCHMSAHENSRTSRIPRGLVQVRTCPSFFSPAPYSTPPQSASPPSHSLLYRISSPPTCSLPCCPHGRSCRLRLRP